jgi:esterase/lipase superfamily enzyme
VRGTCTIRAAWALALAAALSGCHAETPTVALDASSETASTATTLDPLATLVLKSRNQSSTALCASSIPTRAACESAGVRDDAAPAEVLREAKARGAQRIVLFLPGYSATFAQSRAWSATLQHHFGTDSAVVYVDWGTHGSKAEYEADARSARASVPAFASFIEGLHAADPGFSIDVFAHSMGCRVATGTIAAFRNATDARPYVDETVLAAPDVSLADYQHAVARNPKPFGDVTIYVSRYDKALALSSFVHLHRRLGQLAIWRKALPDTTVVDASAAKRVVAGHGYALYDPHVIDDIHLTLERGAEPHATWHRDGFVWKYEPPT